MNERRRAAVLGAGVCVVALAAALDASFPSRVPGAPTSAPSAPASVAMGHASSTAWYCPGPLPVGDRPQSSSIAVANLSSATLTGELRLVTEGGAPLVTPISVAAHAQLVLDLRRGGEGAWAAATLLLAGSGAAVEQVVHGPHGTATSPCSDGPASTTWFPAGSTVGARNLTLSLFDPSATPAVASVTIATGSGTLSPPALQGVSVAAGQLVVLDVGRQAPQQQVIATTVTASAGELVTGGMLVFPRAGGGVTDALTAGSATTSTRWLFAPAPLGPSAREVYAVLDPGSSAATVQVRLTPGDANLTASVPAGGVVQLEPPATASTSMSWASVTSLHGEPVVVARETILATAGGGPAPSTATAPSTAAPALAAGSSEQLGLPIASSEWVLPGGEYDADGAEVVVLANPGRDAAEITVHTLTGAAAGRGSELRLRLAAGSEISLDASSLPSPSAQLAVVVQASGAVVAASFLYDRGPAGGLAGVDAIPVSG